MKTHEERYHTLRNKLGSRLSLRRLVWLPDNAASAVIGAWVPRLPSCTLLVFIGRLTSEDAGKTGKWKKTAADFWWCKKGIFVKREFLSDTFKGCGHEEHPRKNRNAPVGVFSYCFISNLYSLLIDFKYRVSPMHPVS